MKKLTENQKLYQFFIFNGFNVHVKLEENGQPESITHMLDLVDLFPDVDVGSKLIRYWV